ncbi:MAG: putative bifunctional diguanylate cyclase/phosphodiesterase [Acidimicrobiales bacterium]|jgi:diguanylate cyclase (GGDEF)-like protein/PAS domain S-box-containing protein
MAEAKLHGQWSQESELLRELKLTCMGNLLSTTEERVYFKDVRSRFLFVSAGWIAAITPDRSAEDVIGKTDFDFFSKEHAEAAFEDEQRIIRTGEPMVNKLERETFRNGMSPWVSTTKMPLRDETGRIIGTFGISRDVTAQIRAENALAYQVQHDPVTGMANRVAFMERLSKAVADLERQPGRLAVLYVDLDHFKAINDSFGHDAGDQVLAEVGHRLAQFSRHSDTVARLGGDEFVVLCRDLRDDDDVGLIGERIVQGIGAPYVDNGRDLSATCSVGVVITRDPLTEPRHLIRDADAMMYEAKEQGRNQYRIFDASERIGTLASRLQAELSRAIDQAELFLLYQPLFSLEDQSLLGVEALVRWHHPERGVVTPDSFIPFAEQHGLIARIDTFVLDEACRQLSEWTARDNWPRGFTMAVNVSGSELSDHEFAQRVSDLIQRHGVQATRLCLEMTETAFVGEWGDVQETLSSLSELGVRLALDDFGTGYSSLAHLQRMKVDILKIDRSFVAQIGRSERDREIVAAVTAMSHALGITVVGEGIETSHQLDTLAGLDCDQGQGFLFARPLSPEAVVALVG